MTLQAGQRVRVLTDLLTDSGQVIPAMSIAEVIGYAGQRYVVTVHDLNSDTKQTAEAEAWELRSLPDIRRSA